MLEKIHTKLQNNKYIKRDEAPELTTVLKKSDAKTVHKKSDAKKEVSYSIPYISYDNVDMLI